MQCVTASIDKQALIDNVKHIRSLVPNSKIIAVVKANAYGHGLFPVANALKDHADAFAVQEFLRQWNYAVRVLKSQLCY